MPVRSDTDFRDAPDAGAAAARSTAIEAIRTRCAVGMGLGMVRLYQTEWCPHSHKVRQRLTELGVSFVAVQVEPEADDRNAMREETGADVIPVVVLPDGTKLTGEADEIVAELGRRYQETADTAAHHEKA
jgi:glutaredoxin